MPERASEPLFSRTKVRAQMARHGLLNHQLRRYENPDIERVVDPRSDPETIREVWSFLIWLDGETSVR